jgi:FkbM family methyltransferase
MSIFRTSIKKFLKKTGLVIIRTSEDTYGYNINDDVIKILSQIKSTQSELVLFDVGSNIGQSIELYKQHFSDAQIHAFEPSSKTFEILKEKTSKYNAVTYNKMGVGAENAQQLFRENELSDVSSFLEPTLEMWGKVVAEEMVPIITIEEYMKSKNIVNVDFLKIDTQGFDFEVLKGAFTPMDEGRITLIQLEMTLKELYKNLPTMDEIIQYLFRANYKLIAFYGFHNKNIAAQWTDGLFIHASYLEKIK